MWSVLVNMWDFFYFKLIKNVDNVDKPKVQVLVVLSLDWSWISIDKIHNGYETSVNRYPLPVDTSISAIC